jgi:hypothetical protein
MVYPINKSSYGLIRLTFSFFDFLMSKMVRFLNKTYSIFFKYVNKPKSRNSLRLMKKFVFKMYYTLFPNEFSLSI